MPEYAVDCDCRKPKTGLIERAIADFPIDRDRMYMIGDKQIDIVMGKKAKCKKNILVKTGYGAGEIKANYDGWKIKPDIITNNLLDAALFIIKDLS